LEKESIIAFQAAAEGFTLAAAATTSATIHLRTDRSLVAQEWNRWREIREVAP
jgi:hypothetical protein